LKKICLVENKVFLSRINSDRNSGTDFNMCSEGFKKMAAVFIAVNQKGEGMGDVVRNDDWW
jgi:hypothetical protein